MTLVLPSIAERLKSVQARINAACREHGRDSAELCLLAVSKTKPAALVAEAARAGQRHFGENYLQEALAKQVELANEPGLESLHWHFIGPIQSNKSRAIAENFSWVHSVDRVKIAERLSAARPDNLEPLNICLQVNLDAEPSKSGVALNQLVELAQAVAALPRLKLRGLMAIPAPQQAFEQQRQSLARLSQAQRQLQAEGLALDTLSMGMSADLEAAIAAGSTMVRVGTDIFGPRQANAPAH